MIPHRLCVTAGGYGEHMISSWFRSLVSPETRFLRHLEEGRWDKLVPAHQQDGLARFVARAALTPGRTEVVLRFSLGKERIECFWAMYEIVSADTETCQLQLRALCVPKDGHELEKPDGYENEPFFAVDDRRGRTSHDRERKAA